MNKLHRLPLPLRAELKLQGKGPTAHNTGGEFCAVRYLPQKRAQNAKKRRRDAARLQFDFVTVVRHFRFESKLLLEPTLQVGARPVFTMR
jgi:hypothetical protein